MAWLALAIASAMALFASRHNWPFDASGHLKLMDFSIVWGAGRQVLDGAALSIYDRFAHADFVGAAIGQSPDPDLVFGYPPTALLLDAPLGLLDYPVAWIVYTAVGACLWFAALNAVVGDRWLALGMTFAFGAATHNIYLGQNGFFTAALLVGGLSLLPSRPRWAGVLFGILTFKPHLGVALAIALLLWRQWAAMVTGAATAALLALLATALFGLGVWAAYFDASANLTMLVGHNHGLVVYVLQSVFSLASNVAGGEAAMTVHAALALLALGAMIFVTRTTRCHATRAASVIAATLLITPYLFLYDAVMLTGAAAFLIASTRSRTEAWMATLSALLPALWFSLKFTTLPAAAWLMMTVCVLRAVRDRSQEQGHPLLA